MSEGARKILLVDDDDMVRDLVAATLKGGDYQLSRPPTAVRGSSWRASTARTSSSWTSTCPVMDGVSVCQAIKSDPATANVTVIMLTALGQEVDKDRARRAGADGYFTKPFSPLTLLRRVDEVLRARDGGGS